MLITLIITNYNYARYLHLSIESALSQTHPDLQVVVVDDGSRDASREVLDGYADRTELVLKDNGGQASAMNAGFARARGEVVIFLDADDLLDRETAAVVAAAHSAEISKYQWYLDLMDADGRRIGGRIPSRRAEDGDLAARVLSHGPRSYVCPPTSGNAWSRAFLEQVMPLPEALKTGADPYLMDTAPLFGRVLTVERAMGLYRLHGGNMHAIKRTITPGNLRAVLVEDQLRREFLADRARAAGIPVPRGEWADRDWRMLLVRTLLYRSGDPDLRQSLRTLVAAALRSHRSLAARLALAAFLVAVCVVPRRMAFAMSERILNLEYM